MTNPYNIFKALTNVSGADDKTAEIMAIGFLYSYYKAIIELLISFNPNNQEFFNDLDIFVEKHSGRLKDQTPDQFQKLKEYLKQKAIIDVSSLYMATFSDKKREEIIRKIKAEA